MPPGIVVAPQVVGPTLPRWCCRRLSSRHQHFRSGTITGGSDEWVDIGTEECLCFADTFVLFLVFFEIELELNKVRRRSV